jgi:hypothetical protein
VQLSAGWNTAIDPAMSNKDRTLEDLLKGVEGWLPLPEARLLCDLAEAAPADIVEIGCYRGRSTIALCLGAVQSGRLVYSVDPHRPATGFYGGRFGPVDREVYYRNMLASGMAQRAALINLTSEKAGRSWHDPIGLLFIDGDHRYEAVRRDTDIWAPHVVAGGVVVFDDAGASEGGPARVIAELVGGGGYISNSVVGKVHALRRL